MRKLQVKLCLLQEWVKKEGLRAKIVFEGRDTAADPWYRVRSDTRRPLRRPDRAFRLSNHGSSATDEPSSTEALPSSMNDFRLAEPALLPSGTMEVPVAVRDNRATNQVRLQKWTEA